MTKKSTAAVKVVHAEPDMELLAKIVEMTQANSFLYVATHDLEPLLKHDLVEVNRDMVNPSAKNSFATRATTAGIHTIGAHSQRASPQPVQGVPTPARAQTAHAAENAPKAIRAPRVSTSGMTFATALMPPISPLKRGPKTSVYPFDTLEAPQRAPNGSITGMHSFFVPATSDRENPAKSLASTVSSASKRWRKKASDGHGEARKFYVQAVADGERWGHAGVAGAAIYRVE